MHNMRCLRSASICQWRVPNPKSYYLSTTDKVHQCANPVPRVCVQPGGVLVELEPPLASPSLVSCNHLDPYGYSADSSNVCRYESFCHGYTSDRGRIGRSRFARRSVASTARGGILHVFERVD